jgi:hypothetical protein
MPHKIERKFAFGPSALNDLAQAFDTAWLELRAWGIEANTDEQPKCLIETNMEYAAEGEHDVEWVTRVAPLMCSSSRAPTTAFIITGRSQ